MSAILSHPIYGNLYSNPMLCYAKSLQSCPTLCDPIDSSLPGSPVRPWDSPGKNTGVGWHFLLQCMKVKIESEVAQSCPTLSDSMDCSLPGSSVHGIVQARVLEWGAIAFLNSNPRKRIEQTYDDKCLDIRGCKNQRVFYVSITLSRVPSLLFHLLARILL